MRHILRLSLVVFAIAPLACLRAQDALNTEINGPTHLALDATGNLYVSEEYGNRILRISANDHLVTVLAGNGKRSSLSGVRSLAVDTAGNVYIGGRNATDNAFVRVVNGTNGKMTTLVNGHQSAAVGVETRHADLSDPSGIAILPDHTILVSASMKYVVVSLGEKTNAFAGDGRKGFSGDGGLASQARFDSPGSLAVDGSGNVYVADYFNHRIRRIAAGTQNISTVAGTGSAVSSGDGGKATAAGIPFPYAIAVDPTGNLYVVENGQFKVRRVDAATGTITTVAGTGRPGFTGDGGPATKADINPSGIVVDKKGNLFIADIESNRIRRIDPTGTITTIAGNGLPQRKPVIE